MGVSSFPFTGDDRWLKWAKRREGLRGKTSRRGRLCRPNLCVHARRGRRSGVSLRPQLLAARYVSERVQTHTKCLYVFGGVRRPGPSSDICQREIWTDRQTDRRPSGRSSSAVPFRRSLRPRPHANATATLSFFFLAGFEKCGVHTEASGNAMHCVQLPH